MPHAHAARRADPKIALNGPTPARRAGWGRACVAPLLLMALSGRPGGATAQAVEQRAERDAVALPLQQPSGTSERGTRRQPTQATARAGTDEAGRVLNTANGLLGRGLFDLAAPEYERFLREWPDHASVDVAHYGLAVSLHRLGRGEEALEHLEPLARVRGFQFAGEVDLLIGTCRLGLGEYAEAAEALARMRRAHPDHPSSVDAAAMLVEALSRGEHHDDAAREARAFAQAWPDSPRRERTDLFLAIAEISAGRDEQAQRVLEGSLERFLDGALADQAMLLVAQCRHRRGQLGEAAEAYREVARRAGGPMAADALLGLGLIGLADGSLDEAARSLDTVLESYPDSAAALSARLARARVSLEQGDTVAARALLDAVAGSGASDLEDDAAYWLAKCDLRDDRPEDAAERLRAAGRRHPESDLSAEIAYDTAIALIRAGDDQRARAALESFEEAHDGHPLVADAIATLAGVQHRLGEYDESRALCERYLREGGASAARGGEVEFLSAENRYLSGDFARAERAYRQLLERRAGGAATEGGADEASRLAAARFRLAMSVYRQERWGDAEALLEGVADMSPLPSGFEGAVLALGDVLFQRSAWAEAEAVMGRYLDLGASLPGRDDATMKLGLCRARQQRHAEAAASFREVLARYPESVHALQARFEAGQCALALGELGVAKADMESVLEADPSSRFAAHAVMNLGTIAQREGRHDDAAALLARAGELGGGALAAEARLQQGEALLGASQFGDAAEALGAFIEENPDHPGAPGARARLVIALVRDGRAGDAVAAARALGRGASGLDPATRHAMLYEVAWAYKSLDQPDESRRQLMALLDEGPSAALTAHARLALGVIEDDGGESAKAAEAFAAALQAARDAGEASVIEQASYRLGAAWLALEEFDAAAAALDPFVEELRESDLRASALLLRGEALLRANRVQDAAASFGLVIDEHDASEHVGPALLRLGEATAILQLWGQSAAAFAAWLEREHAGDEGDLWFQARFGLGWARENQGRHDEAMAQYALVVESHEGATAARAQFQIGQCLFAQGKHADAARELLKVDILYAYPEWSAAALYEAGRCLMAAGRPSEARAQFQAVRERYADTQWAALAAQRLADASAESVPGR